VKEGKGWSGVFMVVLDYMVGQNVFEPEGVGTNFRRQDFFFTKTAYD
jgi:hypothetical protein